MWDERKILIDNIYKVGMKGRCVYFQTLEGYKEIEFENDEKAASMLRTILQLKEKSPSTFTEVPNRDYTVLPPQRSEKNFKKKRGVTFFKPKSATVL